MKAQPFCKSSLVIALVSGMFAIGGQAALAQDQSVVQRQAAANFTSAPDGMDLRDVSATTTLHIVLGRSTVLRGVAALKRIYVGNPAVLQSFTAGPSEIVLTGKSSGVSSLVIWDTLGHSRLYTVSVDIDPEDLRNTLKDAYPTSHIAVDGHEGRIYLSGTVPGQEVADGAAKLAAPYAKDVVSSIRIVQVHGKQVQLKLRIVEVDRSKMEQYGVNLLGTSNNTPWNVTTGQFPSTITQTAAGTQTTSATGATTTQPTTTTTVSNMLNLFLFSNKFNIGTTIQDLEQKQILQVLAEPTLTAMSGEAAKFLSGGEFPYPTVQGGTAGTAASVSISFRPYGVKVDFTPTVNPDGTILLKVAPEVSTLDYANAVTISGFVVPALSTRRAETEVEIRSGQSFELSGLLDHRTTETLSQIPGISKVPILGKLFITKSYSHSVVELVVMVTATVVDPLTDMAVPAEPEMVVPNLDKNTFDKDLSKEQKIAPKKPSSTDGH
jgi:pilus assembly protein CpaC